MAYDNDGGPPAPTVPAACHGACRRVPLPSPSKGEAPCHPRWFSFSPSQPPRPPPPPPSPPSPPWKKRDTAMPCDVPSQPHSAQDEVDHHGDRAVVVIVVTAAVVATTGRRGRCRRGCRRRFHRFRMNPSTFLPRAVRCATSGGPLSGILQGASSPTPLLPPLSSAAAADDQRSVDAARDLSSCGGVRHHLLLYN